MVGDVVRRPSLGSQLDYRLTELNELERSYVKQLSDDPATADTGAFSLMKPERRARIIDAALDFIQYQSYQARKLDDGQNNNMGTLLVQRSQLAKDNANVLKPNTPPSHPIRVMTRFDSGFLVVIIILTTIPLK
ncbi:MAG: hypothetical protein ACI8P9_005714 [Parasphingorhabdus sp.]